MTNSTVVFFNNKKKERYRKYDDAQQELSILGWAFCKQLWWQQERGWEL
jgi:hypothetical protein